LNIEQELIEKFAKVILLRFAFNGEIVSRHEQDFGHLSCCAAQYLKESMIVLFAILN
jgi:hypothetical protein